MNLFKIIPAALVALFVIGLAGGSFFTVDEGEKAVVVSQGKITGVYSAGFHGKMPFLADAHFISTRAQALEFLDEPVYTADRQTANVSFSVNYAAVAADKEITQIYREYQTLEGLETRILKRQIREQIKNVFGTFTADTAIRERGRLNNEVVAAIADLGGGLVKMEGVNIENINFSDAVEAAAEQRAQAEMLVQTEKQKFEREKVLAEVTVVQAKAEAESNLARKKAEADGIRAIGEAEAASLRAKNEAIKESPNLVELTKAQRWDGALPTTFVPGSATPFLNIK